LDRNSILSHRTCVTSDYSNGGHNLPYVATPAGIQSLQGAQGTALGLVNDAVFQAREVVLARGDVLFLYTDGITEAMDGAGNLYTETRLEDCLRRTDRLSLADLTQAVAGEVYTFAGGAPQSDDLAVLALRYLGCNGGAEGTDLI
jgi:sigma-B regulation protein RsbU (phosphoserine phosphatase)